LAPVLPDVGSTGPLLRYAVPAGARGPAANSGLFPVDPDTLLPVGAWTKSPTLEGGAERFTWHYIIDFWRRNPKAIDPSGDASRRAPGGENSALFFLTGDPQVRAKIPAVERAKLDRQMAEAIALLRRNPWIADPQGLELSYTRRYTISHDADGVEVYGFVVNLLARTIEVKGGSFQTRDGRWHVSGGEWPSMEIASNDYRRLAGDQPMGRYRGLQVINRDYSFLVPGTSRPVFVSEYKTGQGRPTPNPSLFDPARPKTDIQLLTFRFRGSVLDFSLLNTGKMHPMEGSAELVAAAYLTPWAVLLNEVNSPGAPRAD
jgi:hypothetical protein